MATPIYAVFKKMDCGVRTTDSLLARRWPVERDAHELENVLREYKMNPAPAELLAEPSVDQN